MGGITAHIRSLRATGNGLRVWGVEITPVMASDGSRCTITGQVRRDSGRRKGAEAKGTPKACQEGGIYGLG